MAAGPEKRTRRTAAALSGDHPVVPDLNLRDWDCGRWAGHDLADLQRDEPEALASWLSDPASAPHGGETLFDLLKRIEHWMEGEAARGGRAVAVIHPSILRAAMAHTLASGPASFWRVDAKPSVGCP